MKKKKSKNNKLLLLGALALLLAFITFFDIFQNPDKALFTYNSNFSQDLTFEEAVSRVETVCAGQIKIVPENLEIVPTAEFLQQKKDESAPEDERQELARRIEAASRAIERWDEIDEKMRQIMLGKIGPGAISAAQPTQPPIPWPHA